jgi:hypothetical protein
MDATRRYLCLIVMMSCGLLAAEQSYNFAPSGRFILHSRAAREIFHQCSRATPSPGGELWEPSAKDVDELELSLMKYLGDREKSGKHTPPKNVSYHRQYVGFTSKGERFIYGNFYPAGKEFSAHESEQAVQVCDGGPIFWGIVYRVETKTFEEPQFNGVA